MPSEAPFRMIRRGLDWELSAAEVLRLVRADPHPVALLGAWARQRHRGFRSGAGMRCS